MSIYLICRVCQLKQVSAGAWTLTCKEIRLHVIAKVRHTWQIIRRVCVCVHVCMRCCVCHKVLHIAEFKTPTQSEFG